MNLIYGVKDRPRPGRLVLFALQQLLAILAATITVPMVVNSTTGSEMSISAALFGAGAGTLVYLLFTKFRSPVFLGSSFAFINSMCAAFAGGGARPPARGGGGYPPPPPGGGRGPRGPRPG